MLIGVPIVERVDEAVINVGGDRYLFRRVHGQDSV
jgi:hypothetical protein